MNLIIDLKDKEREKVNVEMSWEISVAERQGNFWDCLPWIRKNVKIERTINITIINVSIPKELVCKKHELFSIVVNNKEFDSTQFPVPVNLKQENTPFQLFFNQSAIIDCKESQQRSPKTYTIEFDVVAVDMENVIIDKHHEKVVISFAPLDIKPSTNIYITQKNIQYSSQLSELKIGEIVAWVEEDYQYTPKLNFTTSIALFDGKKDLSSILYFKKSGDKQTNQITSFLLPSRKALQRFEMFINLSKISNPIDEIKTLTIVNRSRYSIEYSPEIIQPMPEQMDEICVKRDGQSAELKVLVGDDVDHILTDMKDGDTLSTSNFAFTPNSHMLRQLSIGLMNAATDNSVKKAGVIIKNFSITDTVLDDVRVFDNLGKQITFFTAIDGEEWDDLNSSNGFFLKNQKDSFTELSLTFNPSNIADIVGVNKDYNFLVETFITFDYFENKKGQDYTDANFKRFSLTIRWALQLQPYPEWLCVDYGSSAIVCKYDNTIINLREQKEKVFEDDRNGYEKFTDDTYEKNTSFLSSDILFHNLNPNQTETSLCVEQKQQEPYNTLSVCLSPTSSLVMNEVQRQLPCLKILVGNMNLPQNAYYDTFSYTRIDSSTGKVSRVKACDAKSNNEANSLLNITTIFEEAYNELFRYFISPITIDKKKLNKLVLTYPNTYTPKHLNIVRDIAKHTFPFLREGYLRFVSESDAVAAYYLSNWNRFNKGRDINEKETVLVYDMGAGTLDITVFNKYVGKSKKIEVEILGKIGTGKAGNYLDYIIADIMSELKLVTPELVSTDFVSNTFMLKDRLKLKNVIKSEIKPRLSMGQKIIYNTGKNSVEVDAEKIITHPKFQKYIDDITIKIIKQITRYIDKDFIIDTIILSGRSCRLGLLRKAVENAVTKSSNKQLRIIEFDSYKDEEKTIVSEGAISQVSKFDIATSKVQIKSRRLYASYGVVFQELGGKIKYVELLNHNEIPYVSQTGIFDGKNIKINGTSSSSYIRLIQTYMSAKETEICYNEGNFEFISDMEEYDMSNFNHADELNVRLSLDRINNISLYVNGLKSIASTPKGVDLTSEITKKSIWPVTI